MATPIKKGKRAGFVDLTTRAPAEVLADLKHRLAPKFGGTLTAMFDVMLRTFLADKPWEKGLAWRETKALSVRQEDVRVVYTEAGHALETPITTTVATGWVQVNMRLEPVLADRVLSVSAINGVSPSTVLYTAIYYWIWYLNPTKSILDIRAARKKRIEARNRAKEDAE